MGGKGHCLSECYGTVFCTAQIVRKLKSISNFPKQLVKQNNCVYIYIYIYIYIHHKTQTLFGFETSSETFSVS